MQRRAMSSDKNKLLDVSAVVIPTNTKCRAGDADTASTGSEQVAEEQNKYVLLQRVITILGWTFELANPMLSIALWAFVIVNAVAYFERGYTVWGSVTVGLMGVWQIALTGSYLTGHETVTWPPWALKWLPSLTLQTLFVFFFWPIVPALFWSFACFAGSSPQGDVTSAEHHSRTQVSSLAKAATTRVAREEARAVERSCIVIDRMYRALMAQHKSLMFLFLEAGVGSLPQMILHVVASACIGSPTVAQYGVAAVAACTLFTKLHFVTLSCNVVVWAWKLSFAGHDLFSLLYLTVTLLSKEAAAYRTINLFGTGVMVSKVGYVWAIKTLVVLAILACIGVGAVLYFVLVRVFHYRGKKFELVESCQFAASALLAVVCAVPAMALGEGGKLLWLLGPISRYEQHWFCDEIMHSTILFSFLKNRMSDWLSKMQHLYQLAFCEIKPSISQHLKTRWEPLATDLLGLSFQRVVDPSVPKPPAESPPLVPFRHKELLLYSIRSNPLIGQMDDLMPEKLGQLLAYGFWALIGVSSFVSFLYPFAYVAYHPLAEQTLLQQGVFVGIVASLVVTALLSHAGYHYVLYCVESMFVLDAVRVHARLKGGRQLHELSCQWVCNAITTFYHPTGHQVLSAVTSSALLPSDVLGVVSEFLSATEIEVGGMSVAECRACKT